jgi:phage gp36-like protein
MANNYAQLNDFYIRYDTRTMAQLSNDNASTAIASTTVQALLDSQASYLESHLNGRYPVPVPTPVPALLTDFVCDMTALRLYGRRVNRPKYFDEMQRFWYDWLRDIRSGIVSLPGLDGGQAPTLYYSDYTNGQSRFDVIPNFDGIPTNQSAAGKAYSTGNLQS